MRTLIKRLLVGAACVAVLGLVFVSYLRPSFIVDIANQIILCL
ncbi:MAG: hypothetical protein V7606_3915 [Burkholderiales bacterium]|jgi:hypothetical protein|nr:hypothetical protein [Burkholderia sp.]